jgi:hypothetical protein
VELSGRKVTTEEFEALERRLREHPEYENSISYKSEFWAYNGAVKEVAELSYFALIPESSMSESDVQVMADRAEEMKQHAADEILGTSAINFEVFRP